MQTTEQPAGARGSDRLLWGIVGAAVVLMVAGFALLLVVRERQPTQFAEDTPQGVVQRYLQAQSEGRFNDAESYIAQSVKDNEPKGQRPWPNTAPQNSYRIVMQDAKVDTDKATVTVGVTQFNSGSRGGLFGGSSEYTATHVFELRRETGNWKIIAPPYPILY